MDRPQTVSLPGGILMLREYGWKPNSLWGTDPVFLRSALSIPHFAFYITDHLGTPHALIDFAGATVWSATYDTFGQATVTSSEFGTWNSELQNPLRFPGQYFDSESGLHYNFHRYYNPAPGRYNRSMP